VTRATAAGTGRAPARRPAPTRVCRIRVFAVWRRRVVSLDSVDEHEQARSEDARYTLLMHDTRFASGGMLWSSPHATVLTNKAPLTANAALALIWSVVELIAAFHDCCAPGVRARFRCARARRTSVYVWRNR